METPLFNFNPDQDALFLDIDGTLLDIAPTPHSVIVPTHLVTHLYAMHQRLGGALALISGRAISDIDALLKADQLPAAGSHGAEWRLGNGPNNSPVIHNALPLPHTLQEKLSESFKGMDGILMEDKAYSIAIHYRLAPQHQHLVEATVREIIAQQQENLTLLHGKMVVEIVRPEMNKGDAILRFMQYAPFRGRRPVVLGDDETDISAMGAALSLGGIAARVTEQRHSKSFFPSPSSVRDWLERQVSLKAIASAP